MTAETIDVHLRPGSSTCLCPTCGRYFSNEGNFDKHRAFARGHAGDWDHRRCLTPKELQARGMVERDGVWRGQPPAKALPNWHEAALA